jgi:ribonuclease Z
MTGLAVNCLGVGDGWPCADRRHSAFVYRAGRTSILIDCGEGVSGAFKASGLGCDTVDALFLSHLHADHVGGFPMLVQGFWLEGRRKPLIVRAPAEGLAPLQGVLRAGYLFDEVLPFRLAFEPLVHGRAVKVGDVRVTPFHTSHLDRLRQRGLGEPGRGFEAFSFLIETPGRRIGHSADIGAPKDLDPLLAQPLDLLLCELAHGEPEALLARLRQASIRQVVFMHLARSFWEHLSATRRLLRRGLGEIPFVIAKDGTEVRV